MEAELAAKLEALRIPNFVGVLTSFSTGKKDA
jgi:hypothetical protein